MFKCLLKLLLGIIVSPVCVAVSVSLYDELSQIRALSHNQKYFISGAVTYLIIHVVFFKPQYLYILGHEIMHALAALFSRGKVISFKVSSKGGQVTATRSNIFIALAPYFFPFYTILTAGLFFLARLVIKPEPPYGIFLFLLGLTLTFHIVLTIDFLKTKQTDFLYGGQLFSIALVYIVNLVILGLILSLLFEEVSFTGFLKSAYFQSKQIYLAVFRQLFL